MRERVTEELFLLIELTVVKHFTESFGELVHSFLLGGDLPKTLAIHFLYLNLNILRKYPVMIDNLSKQLVTRGEFRLFEI